jgi:hypothetical protein
MLNKSLYGLETTPRAWYEKIDMYLIDHGFSNSRFAPTLYVKHILDELLILVIYIDDILLTGIDELRTKFQG